MAKRKLRRQLNLLQVIMLGTAGTIAAEIFVLTGHAAGIAGPEAVLALILGGILTLPIAINYCELATTYPVTGGAMTYVGEGFGKGLLMFLVGSLDGLSSTFYAALSAIGFAISLNVFLPFLPIVPVAIGVIVVVALLHMRGVSGAGNLQIVLGGFLLLIFGIFVVKGLTSPNGFHMDTFLSGKVIFEHQTLKANLGRMLTTIALTYSAYVGFEVIADDAEEITNPNRNIPLGILISLLLATVVYSSVAFVTIGTIPYDQLAGSETALTDAAARFWPGLGVPLLAAAGIVATLTSVNSAMLSATREAFTLSRERVWPRVFGRLSRWRTPYAAIIFIAGISILVAMIGLVDFLSFISSAGYMFVLIWASMAMIRLHQKYPNIERPFKAPFFPLTAYLAAGSGLLIVAFANPKALLFLAIVLLVLTVIFFIYQRFTVQKELQQKVEQDEGGGRLLLAVNQKGVAASLVKLGTLLVDQEEDTSLCLFNVLKTPITLTQDQVPDMLKQSRETQSRRMQEVAPIATAANVPLYSKQKVATRVEEGILGELNRHKDIRMVLLGYPRHEEKAKQPHNILKEVMMLADRDVAIFRDKGLKTPVDHVLVPVGNGPNAKLALRLAQDIISPGDGKVTAFRLVIGEVDEEQLEDELAQLHEIVEAELGEIPANFDLVVREQPSVYDGILDETIHNPCDLLIIGATEEVLDPKQLFGRLNDALLDEVGCSMMIVRRFQRQGALWLNKQIKRIEE